MSGVIKIYVCAPRWFIRPSNTDWLYVRRMIPRMTEFAPVCEFILSQSLTTTMRSNLTYLNGALRRYAGLSSLHNNRSTLDVREFRHSRCRGVFCHDYYPENAEGIRVIWQNSILDPEMMLASRASPQEFERIKEEKAAGFMRAYTVMVSTEAERQRLGNWFPDQAHKFAAVPFFLPDVQTISQERLEQKLARKGELRCLFVGHQARRKGLARVYDALQRANSAVQRRIHLTVVSGQTDGVIPAPALPNLRILPGLPHNQVVELMRESDVLLMPSFFESYGLAYVEAMAQGTIPIVPDWEVQRELVDYGRAGVVTSGDPGDLTMQIEKLCDDAPFRSTLAREALHRFETHYAPQVVADKFAAMAARLTQ